MFDKEFYDKMTSDIARKVTDVLVEQLSEVLKSIPDLPIAMRISEASKRTGISASALRQLYQDGVISGKHTGTSDNSPILLHTASILNYLATENSKEQFLQIIKRIAA